jgi:hypothetical protein
MIETNPDPKVIEFENKVIAMARMLYPGVSCFSPRHLDPIRKQIKETEAKMKVPVKAEPKVETLVAEEPKKEQPKNDKPKRKYKKRK